jgi:GDP/UDP-N,N'-diacetylbacillosamine 2-epimerase (hydrolysing)
MKRRVCVVTATRAEYGLLRRVMQLVRASARLELQVVATGTHLSAEFGSTWREIEADGLQIDRKVDMRIGADSAVGVSKSMALALDGVAEALAELSPDIVLVLGDRYEILAVAAAALIARVPVAHLHGGEVTEGAFDDALRHAITKLSQLHFVAAEEYRRRVIQLGEDPARVHLVGGLGVDNLTHLTLLGRAELEESLGFELGERSLLITFHPVTAGDAPSAGELVELLAALDALQGVRLVFTMPNADPGHRALAGLVEKFVAQHPHARAYTSLGYIRYLSCMKYVDGVVGNTSSGLTEAPSFRTGTVNVGDRQKGRLKAASVIDCAPTRDAIGAAIDQLFSRDFQATLAAVRNPYGEGGAAERIVTTLESCPDALLRHKSFFDLPASPGLRA